LETVETVPRSQTHQDTELKLGENEVEFCKRL